MEVKTWGLWTFILLAANFALPVFALYCWRTKGSLRRMPVLRLYLAFSALVALTVPLVTLFGHFTRPEYRKLYTAVDVMANLMLCGVAWELCRLLLPSVRMFVSLWAAGLSLALVAVYLLRLTDNTPTLLWLSIFACAVAAGIAGVGALLMPLSLWSKEYAAVGLGLAVIVMGNAVVAALQLRWVYQHFAFLRLALPFVSLVSYAAFCWASCSPQVTDEEHMGGLVASL